MKKSKAKYNVVDLSDDELEVKEIVSLEKENAFNANPNEKIVPTPITKPTLQSKQTKDEKRDSALRNVIYILLYIIFFRCFNHTRNHSH